MTKTTEPQKVYELAKDLDIDSISLLGKLKDLDIKVKSHMSTLTPEQVEITLKSFKSKKKTSTKKTESKKETSAKKATISRKHTKKADVSPKAEEEVTPEIKSGPTIIRRRVKADGMVETVAPASIEKSTDATANKEQIIEQPQTTSAPIISTQAPESTHEPEIEATQVLGEIERPSEETTGKVTREQTTEVEKIIETAATPEDSNKKFLKIVESVAPPINTIIPPSESKSKEKPKKSLKPTTDGEKDDGFRIIKMNKQALDLMAEEEKAKKRTGKNTELRPEDVKFADYQKKEVVFLPKKKKIPLGKEIKKTKITTPKAIKRIVEVFDNVTIQDLANNLKVKPQELIKKLMGMGQMATINQEVDFETASLIANEFGFEVRNVAFKEETILAEENTNEKNEKPRPPIVTVMGHVDHGKTSLLDVIRKSNVVDKEAGGITQHIGAYTITKDGNEITFIDTPGHAAFTAMRARGANVTDIVVLVVAADDGPMPQTREAIDHARAAKVPIIVAINKMDLPGANPEKIKQNLSELGLLPESWGGETQFLEVSAKKQTGIDKLLEAISLQAEILELKSDPTLRASGVVLESKIVKGRGPVVSVLVLKGTLRRNDFLVCGTSFAKVKLMNDDRGKTVKEAKPGIAVEVSGFETTPNAGDKFDNIANDADARKIIKSREDVARTKSEIEGKIQLDNIFAKIQAGNIKELKVILKADVFGSVEAIKDNLVKISTDKVKINVILAAPGGISESDVILASASEAIIIGFNVRPDTKARQIAASEHIEIKTYTIIYELFDDIKNSMTGLLDKKKVEKFLGRAEIRQTFIVPKIGTIGGSSVIDGKIIRGADVRLLRDSRVIYEGKMSSLKRFKDDTKEVSNGYECGIGLENYNDIKPGDIVEAYEIEWITPELSD